MLAREVERGAVGLLVGLCFQIVVENLRRVAGCADLTCAASMSWNVS